MDNRLFSGGAALMTLLATSIASAQGTRLSGYADGTSNCFRSGDRVCSLLSGPYRQVGEASSGPAGVAPGGNLAIKGGLYPEPVFLYKNMQISAENGAVTIGPASLAPFDLVVDRVDDNGLPLNPKWAAQRVPPGEPPDPGICPETTDILGRGPHTYRDPSRNPCTHQFAYKNYSNPEPIIGSLCGPHINWFGVTYQGTVTWEAHSCPPDTDDNDYNINFTRPDRAGYAATRDNLHCEFDEGETVARFNSPWWVNLRNAVAHDDALYGCGHPPSDPSAARIMFGGAAGSAAIISAMMGFDTEHETFVELHPVWALAINEYQSTFVSDFWTFFVRNWGNEGYCGHNQQFIHFPNNRYTFRLPWKAGATSVSVTSQSWHPFNTQAPPPSITIVTGEAVLVRFNLDPPRNQGSMWDGELILHWL